MNSIIQGRIPQAHFDAIDALPGKRTEHVQAAIALYLGGPAKPLVSAAIVADINTADAADLARLREMEPLWVAQNEDNAKDNLKLSEHNHRLFSNINKLNSRLISADVENEQLRTELASLNAELEEIRSRPERIPSPPKKVVTWKPLSAHTKSRMQVLRSFDVRLRCEQTSSDAAHTTGQNTNNVAKRIQELAAEGYIEETGEYRKSRDSGKMLRVWKRTAKPLPEVGR
jgi:hypothetical protein